MWYCSIRWDGQERLLTHKEEPLLELPQDYHRFKIVNESGITTGASGALLAGTT